MNFAERVKSFLAKSFSGEGNDDTDDEDDLDLDTDQDGEGGEDVKKGDLVDATEILGSLVTELGEIKKSLKTVSEKQNTFEKSQSDVGEALVCISEVLGKIAGTPLPAKSVMAKGNLGSGSIGALANQVTVPKEPPTLEEFEQAQGALVKSVQAGKISMQKAEIISSDMQKAMNIPGYSMRPENYAILAREMRVA
jgi:predicted transcriptional regulator